MRRASLALAAAMLAAASAAAQQPTFSSRIESVRLDVRVTDRGRVVKGLRAEDFEVLDSGVRQTVDHVSSENLPLDVILAFDSSPSVAGERLEHLREAGHAVLDNVRREDRVALLTFTDLVRLREQLTADAGRVRTSLDQVQPESQGGSGGTALIDAVLAALTLSDRDVGRTLLLVFTDGVETSSFLSAERVIAAAQRSNAVIYAVSAAKLRKGDFIPRICDATGGDAFEIASTRELRATFIAILDEFRQRYLVSFTPTGVPAGGWHPLTVRVKGRSVTLRARPGYFR